MLLFVILLMQCQLAAGVISYADHEILSTQSQRVIQQREVLCVRSTVYSWLANEMGRSHDIEGEFYVFPTEKGGRKTPATSGYRPQHKIYENYQTSGEHEYLNAAQVAPGDTVSTRVWFLTPEVYPKSLWIGREIGVFEGPHQVGTLTITSVLNELLVGRPEIYNPVWVEPPSLGAQGGKVVG